MHLEKHKMAIIFYQNEFSTGDKYSKLISGNRKKPHKYKAYRKVKESFQNEIFLKKLFPQVYQSI